MTAVTGISGQNEDVSHRQVMLQSIAAERKMASSKDGGAPSMGFADMIDVINPLQHIPGVSGLYRAVTNDQISEEASQAGRKFYGFVLGGPLRSGFMAAYQTLTGQKDDRQLAETGGPPASPAGLDVAAASSVTIPLHTAGDTAVNRTMAVANGADNQMFMGETVASVVQRKAGTPLDLTLFQEAVSNPVLPDQVTGSSGDEKVPEKGRISGAPVSGTGEGPDKPFLPDDNGLDRLSAHSSNYLSLDVLKALQERHVKLAASQQS